MRTRYSNMIIFDAFTSDMSGDFQDEIECLGIEASPSFVREPEGKITMDNELLYAKIAAMEGKRPLAGGRDDEPGALALLCSLLRSDASCTRVGAIWPSLGDFAVPLSVFGE
jgi:hypothetical protein